MINTAVKKDYARLRDIWESAVKETHHFLKEEDFEFYKSQLFSYFDYVDLYVYKDNKEQILGFLGVADSKIEMLFIDSESRGTGIGKRLLTYAMEELKAYKLDVNEQNEQAIGFYLHQGFKVIRRSEYDSEGKDYPLLHLERISYISEKDQ